MPTFRSPFTVSVSPDAPVGVDGNAAAIKLFIATVALAGAAPDVGPTTLLLGEKGGQGAFAIATVSSAHPVATTRVIVPVELKSQTVWQFSVSGPGAVVVSGEQHTKMSREQVDAVGSAAVGSR